MKNEGNHDLLRVNGIFSRGYGLIPKAIMADPTLDSTEKAILGYFSSYAGAGLTAFPSREKILDDLHLGVNTYTKHLKVLKARGLIKVTQKSVGGMGKGFTHNIYTLDFNAGWSDPDQNREYMLIDINTAAPENTFDVRMDGIFSKGYGLVPKAVMTDRTLSCTAKAIYLYIVSFSGGSTTARPKTNDMTFHLAISEKTYQTHMRMLTEAGYITVKQIRTKDGRMSGNVYIQNLSPSITDDADEPDGKNCDTQKLPGGKNCDTQNLPYGKKPYTQNSDTNINSSENISPKDNLSINRNSSTYGNTDSDGSMDTVPAATKEYTSLEDYYRDNSEKIEEALNRTGQIPYEWLSDEMKLESAIRVLTDWDRRLQYDEGSGNPMTEDRAKALRTFAASLTDLLKASDKYHTVLDQQISYARVHEAMSAWYDREESWDDDSFSSTSVNLRINELFNEIWSRYAEATPKVKNPFKYMQSCIWSALRNGRRPENKWRQNT